VNAFLDPCALAEVGNLFGFKPLDPQWAEWCEATHPKQRAAVCDTSHNVAVIAGRRAGKTEGCIYWLARDWQTLSGKKSLYVASTIGSAREIIWDRLHDFDERWGIGIDFNESRLEATFPNDYTIIVTGCENKKQANRVARGKRFAKVVIDEVELFEDELIRYFIRSALKPTLMDYGGKLMLMGTPGNALVGYWYEITREPDAEEDEVTGIHKRAKPWPTHRYNALDNPFIQYPGGAAKFLADQLVENGWTEEDPEYIIEYLGRWVHDGNSYIYPFSEAKNLWDDDDDPWFTAAGGVKTVIGVDLGDRDGCGFAVLQKRWDSDEIRVLEAWATVNLDVDELAVEIKKLMRRHKTHHVRVDSKGHGATTICKSLLNYGIPAEPAENNRRKLPLIRDLKAVLRNGKLKLHPTRCRDGIAQLRRMVWNDERDSHREGIPDEAIDPMLWALFELRKLALVKPGKAPRPTEDEKVALEEALENKRAERNAERMKRLSAGTHRAKAPAKGRRTNL
jgi:hypothetical protein